MFHHVVVVLLSMAVVALTRANWRLDRENAGLWAELYRSRVRDRARAAYHAAQHDHTNN